MKSSLLVSSMPAARRGWWRRAPRGSRASTRSIRWRALPALLALLALLAPGPAHAEATLARGVVLKVELQEIYVNLSATDGVAAGQPLRLKRPIRLRHPVTRAVVEDWIPLGAGTVTQAGNAMSRAVLGELASAVKAGDLVEVLVERPASGPSTPPPAAPPPPPPPDGPPPDPSTLAVLEVFAAQLGQPVAARIAGWEGFLSQQPASPYADEVRRELAALRQLRDELDRGEAVAAPTPSTARHTERGTTAAGVALPLVFVLERPAEVASAYLHYRTRGAATFHSVLLDREHEIYLRGTLPAAVVTPPGVDYFVEVSDPTGRAGLALGSPERPVHVRVAAPSLVERLAAAPRRSSVHLAFELLDFATFDRRPGDRTDRLATATVDFTYRLDGPVRSLGVGYGALSGEGGLADTVWLPMYPAPRTGFQYGYAEVEVASDALGEALDDALPLALAARVIAGVGRDGFGLGIAGRLRVGELDGANLAFSASSIEEVGFLSEVRFGVPLPRALRLGVFVGATDQPGRGDIGVKLGSELEWLGLGRFALLVRGSWQGRTIDHGGIGGGAGIGAYW